MAPSLIYHSTNPTLYPTNNPDKKLLVIRFNGPTRVSNLRIIPEGVESLNGGTGTTYPTSFTGKLLLNISPSNPINALTSTIINVIPSENPLDYAINMPVGVTTRMIMFFSPAQKLSISIYGYTGDSLLDTDDSQPQAIETVSHTNTQVDGISPNNGPRAVSDDEFEWLYTWAGPTPSSLLDLLNEHEIIPKQISDRALECLELYNQIQPIFPLLTLPENAIALEYIINHPSSSSIRETVLSNHEYALHPSISPYLPSDHPLKVLVEPSTTTRHQQAWKNLHLGLGPLLVLQEDGVGEDELLGVEKGEEKSDLMRLVNLSNTYLSKISSNQDKDSVRDKELIRRLGIIADILNRPFQDQLLNRYLSGVLPRLVVHLNIINDTKRELELPLHYSKELIRQLVLLRSEVVEGMSTRLVCDQLCKKCLDQLGEDDPLRKVLEKEDSVAIQGGRSVLGGEGDEDSRRLNRLSSALTSSYSTTTSSSSNGNPISSLIHTITPSELISLLSPHLFSELSTSKQPPFGIKPSILSNEFEGGTKSFAGKVYTQHEFRRDRNPDTTSGGMGVGPSSMGLGISMGMGNMGGLGINSSSGGGRAASRHVDSYSRG